MPKFTIECRGDAPLLMRSALLVDPLERIVKEIKELTAKTGKTDEDHLELARLEFIGGIYYVPELGPAIPAMNLWRALVEGARLSRRGPKIERGVVFDDVAIAIQYDGPRELEELAADRRFRHRVPVTASAGRRKARVMRTRPMFSRWAIMTTGLFNSHVLNLSDLRRAAEDAGMLIGLGDGRPLFGRFTTTVKGE